MLDISEEEIGTIMNNGPLFKYIYLVFISISKAFNKTSLISFE